MRSEAAEARRAARRFLAAYLAYLHGRRRANRIGPATGQLRRRLRASRTRVSPAARRHHVRLAGMRQQRLSRDRFVFAAEVVVADGVRYPVLLRVERSGRRWLATGVGAE